MGSIPESYTDPELHTFFRHPPDEPSGVILNYSKQWELTIIYVRQTLLYRDIIQ